MVYRSFLDPILGGPPLELFALPSLTSWLGSPLIVKKLPLAELTTWLPRFERKPLENPSPREHPTRPNPHYDLVVRLPVADDPATVPVGVVSTSYQLIQHHEVAEAIGEALEWALPNRPPSPVLLVMTRLGERMLLSVPLEGELLDPGDGWLMAPSLDCINSVDGSTSFSLTLAWVRLVCSNGLVLRESWQLYRRRHLRGLDAAEIREAIEERLEGIAEDRRTFKRWMETTVTLDRVASWLDNVLRHRWGYHAAARAQKILTTGWDGEVMTSPRAQPPSRAHVRPMVQVPGFDTSTPLNLYTVAQVLAWIASRRSSLQERLEGRKEIELLVQDLQVARA